MIHSLLAKNTLLLGKVIIFIIILLTSCETKPKIENKRLKEVLVKIHECEAYHELKLSSQRLDFLEACKNSALKETNVDKDLFDKTIIYYKNHPKEFEELYDSILINYQ